MKRCGILSRKEQTLMLEQEATWIASILIDAPNACDHYWPLLNVGSSVNATNDAKNPWIRAKIFGRAENQGLKVINVDIKHGDGVDVVADISDSSCLEILAPFKYRAILCSNVMEHVPESLREKFAENLQDLVRPGEKLILTVPYEYPLHPDPIDTGFRPQPQELVAMFPQLTVQSQQLIESGNWYDLLGRRPFSVLVRLIRLLLPFYHPRGWLLIARHFPWLFKPFSVACVVFTRNHEL